MSIGTQTRTVSLDLPPTPAFDYLCPEGETVSAFPAVRDTLLSYMDENNSCSEDGLACDQVAGMFTLLEIQLAHGLITSDALRTSLRYLWTRHRGEDDL